ncbi:MAG TPA: carboxypeptidase-like regulatory domain-containing protein [Acidobacteriaceae bacterium]|nr:carboxypeptidase-like regulatory domain-containing protein [Acidobacteriaceae bacterium]
MNLESSVRLVIDGWKRSILLIVACFALTVSATQAEGQRITAAGLCGVVTDLAGVPVEKATVTAMFGDTSKSQETDKAGQWNFGRGVGPHWMQVEGRGLQTFEFDYVDKAGQKSGGADNSDFLSRPKGEPCATPIYVRLAPLNHKRGLVTLDPSKGVHKEKKSK